MKKNFWKNLWKSITKLTWHDVIWIPLFIITSLITTLIVLNVREAQQMEHNRAMLAIASTSTAQPTPTCPGIADTAGNCMEEFSYSFTVDASPTPQPFCTPVYCPAGEYVCNQTNGCPNGCGLECMVDEPASPEEPDLVCLYWYQYSPIKQRCYPKP